MEKINFNGLDTTVHGPLRLGILSSLQSQGKLDFTDLKKQLEAVDGSLSMHLRKLEEVGYISCHKGFVGRRPKSTYTITRKGQKALIHYLDSMQALINQLKAT